MHGRYSPGWFLRCVFLLVAVTASFGQHPRTSVPRLRTYYIADDEVPWDYTPQEAYRFAALGGFQRREFGIGKPRSSILLERHISRVHRRQLSSPKAATSRVGTSGNPWTPHSRRGWRYDSRLDTPPDPSVDDCLIRQCVDLAVESQVSCWMQLCHEDHDHLLFGVNRECSVKEAPARVPPANRVRRAALSRHRRRSQVQNPGRN